MLPDTYTQVGGGGGGGGENGKWDKTVFKPREKYMIFPKMRGKIYSRYLFLDPCTVVVPYLIKLRNPIQIPGNPRYITEQIFLVWIFRNQHNAVNNQAALTCSTGYGEGPDGVGVAVAVAVVVVPPTVTTRPHKD